MIINFLVLLYYLISGLGLNRGLEGIKKRMEVNNMGKRKWIKLKSGKLRRLRVPFNFVKSSKGKLILTTKEIARGLKRNKRFFNPNYPKRKKR